MDDILPVGSADGGLFGVDEDDVGTIPWLSELYPDAFYVFSF